MDARFVLSSADACPRPQSTEARSVFRRHPAANDSPAAPAPVSPTKWLLRRFDHSAIYLLIAGTYTPFLALLKSGIAWTVLTTGLWSSALAGVLLKIALPGRFDRLSIALYLLMGWSGVMAYQHFIPVVPGMALWLLASGGIFYSLGTIFHLWETLRFQNAIWHGCVLIAASCHYCA